MTANPPPVRLCACGTEALSLEAEACSCAAKTKPCSLCGITKPLTDFYVNAKNKDGRQSRCKKCQCQHVKSTTVIVTRTASKVAFHRARESNREAVRMLPMTRGECCTGIRPCPFVSCLFNCAIDVGPKTGTIRLAYGSEEIEDWPESNCALDNAEQNGGMNLDEIGAVMGIGSERVRQIEETALRKLRNNAVVLKALQGALEDG